MKRYEGPIANMMVFEDLQVPDNQMTIMGWPWDAATAEILRNAWRPIRPMTPQGWALFLPDAVLPDTGPINDPRVGEVYASRCLPDSSDVFEIERIKDGVLEVKILAGDSLNWMAVDSLRAHHSVLLFDAPAVVQRAPVAPWVRLERAGYWANGARWDCTQKTASGGFHHPRAAAAYAGANLDGACEECAESAGVFGPPAIKSRSVPQPSAIASPVKPKPPAAPVTKPAWKCDRIGCKTPDAPRGPGMSSYCFMCREEAISEAMRVAGNGRASPRAAVDRRPAGVHPSYLPHPSVYASPFKPRDRSDVVVRADVDDLP